MPNLILTLLRLIFLTLVYLFVWQVARSIAGHLGLRKARGTRKAGSRIVVVRSESQSGLTFSVSDVTVVGRSSEADVLLEDPYASEFHFRLASKDQRLVLTDLGSTNGTYVNGRRITSPID